MHLKKLFAAFLGCTIVLATNILGSDVLTAAGDITTDYDYIVVGSGPGGGPLAARLASAGFKVLLIDAGSDQGSSLQETVPTLWPVSAQYAPMQWNYFVNHYADPARAQKDSKYTWQTPNGDYYTGPSPPENSTALGILYPRAGTLGGCAAHNALIAIYPHDDDYTYIEKVTGDKSWSPRNMRLLFEKLEKNEYVGSGASGHGHNGWFGTSVLDLSILANDTKVDALAESMYAAINNKKLGTIPKKSSDLSRIMQLDVNGPGNTAKPNFYQLPLAVENGTRSSPRDFILQIANAAYANGTKKYSLDVWLNTFVTKIVFDQTAPTPQAVGVEYVQGVGLYSATPSSYTQIPTGAGKVLAAKEIIISTGAFNTPQLLKLSGIGPKDELNSFGIPVVVDLPGVGQNLQDRYEMGVVSSTTSSFEILNGCTLISASPDECLQQWQSGSNNAKRGFYGGNAFPLATVFKSSVAASDPDVFIFGGPVSFSGFFPGWANVSTLLPSKAPGWWSWVVLKAHTRNTAGNVTLRSVNPLDTPVINFNSFDTGTTANNSDQLDLQASYEGIQLARQANANLAALVAEYGSAYSSSPQGLTPFTEVFPGTQHTGDDLKNVIKNEAFGHHASCTAAIGANDDPLAVLDTNFKVRGVKGLRVVDASSFPKTPGFFPAVPLYMMSEKAAIVIAKDQNVTISYAG